MESIKEFVCIGCPVGCRLRVTLDADGKVTEVSGNTCRRGDEYARSEMENPVRTLTSTVKLLGGELPLVPVRTDRPIPKAKLMPAMECIRAARAAAPVVTGQVLIPDVASTGANVVATRDVGKSKEKRD